MINEIWVPAIYIFKDGTRIDFGEYYEVSNLGALKSLRKGTINRFENTVPNKYISDVLYKDNRKYSLKHHRLVLSSFNPDGWFEGAECGHNDDCKTNNNINNLSWVTSSENKRHNNLLERIYQTKVKNGICYDREHRREMHNQVAKDYYWNNLEKVKESRKQRREKLNAYSREYRKRRKEMGNPIIDIRKRKKAV